MRPTIRIHNIETNQIIDREMDEAEFAAHKLELLATIAETEIAMQLIAAKVAAEAKLAALGLTTDDLKALGLGGNE